MHKHHYTRARARMRASTIALALANAHTSAFESMGWLRLVGSIKLQVSFAKEPYKRDAILQKKPIIESILLTVATPYLCEPGNLFTMLCSILHFLKRALYIPKKKPTHSGKSPIHCGNSHSYSEKSHIQFGKTLYTF